ncbi:MAG: dihydroxyacetone kinase subunit DhaK [Acidobacteria bacterium]|nr:MAG: dihydroxyacetone kinase subunit DhaK [Acidobacteriota bacterium]
MRNGKKVINDPCCVVSELLNGVTAAAAGRIIRLPGATAVVRADPKPGKVGLLIGGGSGHEPLFPGFVGHNMADGAACGHIFTAPTPDVILAATKALDQGKGVLYVYGNYAGDNMNFDLATELASEEGISTKTVRVWDDVASAPPDRFADRRGIAGDLFVIKVAGGVSSVAGSLEEAERVTAKARDNTRSMGVALGPGSIPGSGEPTFELADDEIEIGMGLHGERGVSRGKMMRADELVARILERILVDLPFRAGDQVCLLVNDLGATTMMELLIANRKAHEILRAREIGVHDTVVGSFCTCQEMSGFSLSLMRLDEELMHYYDLPADSLAFKKM